MHQLHLLSSIQRLPILTEHCMSSGLNKYRYSDQLIYIRNVFYFMIEKWHYSLIYFSLLTYFRHFNKWSCIHQDFFFIIIKHIFLFIYFLFICAYYVWVISPPFPHPLPYHPLYPLPLSPPPSRPSRNYFALISNFVEERV
jgi:hypothetical protein